jgi:Chaperone of endosialidase
MAISVTHAKVSAKPDGVDTSLVQPSDWNATHTITMATARILGRWTAGTGAVEEITVGTGLTLTGAGVLQTSVDLSGYAPLAGPSFTGGITVAQASATTTILNRTGDTTANHVTMQIAGVTRGSFGANATYPFVVSQAGGSTALVIDTSSNLVATGNVSAYSDIAIKTHISTITGALALVQNLRGVRYTRKDNGDRRIGVIAQEVQPFVPEVVIQGEEYLSVSYGDLVGLLIEAVKELSYRVKELEAR